MDENKAALERQHRYIADMEDSLAQIAALVDVDMRDGSQTTDDVISAVAAMKKALEPFVGATLTHTGQVIGLMSEDFARARAAFSQT